MTIWRMAMRVGNKGPDMWPQCRDNGVAAITYAGIVETDLGHFSLDRKPKDWGLTGSQPGSINNFAWRIRGGDVICVRDSMAGGSMIGFGFVVAPLGKPAYRFDPDSSIREPRGTVWRHLIDVDWDRSFAPFRYKDRSPNTTVLKLTGAEVAAFGKIATREQHRENGLSAAESERALLLEDSYPRATSASMRLIHRLHSRLSNDFRKWLRTIHRINAVQERYRIDMTFRLRRTEVLAEFKIAYGAKTRHAIREALGQILEYNHYPQRRLHDEWLLVLDSQPEASDCEFIAAIRQHHSIPITLGWQTGQSFEFYPNWLA